MTLDDYPMYYAAANNNLGNAYRALTEVKDTVVNYEKAIQYYQEALKVYTLDESPIHYTRIHNNLGIAYQALAEVKDRTTWGLLIKP